MNSETNAIIHLAVQHFQSGNFADAEKLLKKVLQAEPNNFGALHVMGVICVFQNRPAEAIGFFRQAVGVNPDNRLANYNLAKVLSESGKEAEALLHHEKAVELGPNDQDAWVNYGKSLSNLGRYDEALSCYGKALAINPGLAEALSNQGGLFSRLGRDAEALDSFEKALAVNPSLPAAWMNKGDTLGKLGRFEQALVQYDRAIQLKPDNADAWYRKGNVLNELKLHDEALVHYERAIVLNPDNDFLYGNRLSTKMSMCDWTGADVLLAELEKKIEGGKQAATPFEVLCVSDSLAMQRKTAETYARSFPADDSLGPISRRPPGGRIRVGYFSRDFRNHATAFLSAELFELHDKSKFEITAFSFGPDKNDAMRDRLAAAFDRFVDVRGMSDKEVARLARELEIDIAVDMQGYQTEHRPGIFACRAAPIQVNYLAFPGTMGAQYMDYIVADATLVPPQSRQYFSEKVAYLPNSYQVNDRKREISGRQFTRKELGLPEEGFVFCCFNGIHKITPATFAGWMNILKEVEGSVLWLFEGNRLAVQNLGREAADRGVSPDRLVFAGFMNLPDHLARHCQADLFLDSLPYDAHTTASDALWAGLPVLTCPGESFASRVAASLLNAVHLPDLIAHSQEEYERIAIDLAKNPDKLAAIKRKLAENRLAAPLFDTPLYARHLEAAYAAMMERYQAGLPPDHIRVG